MHEWWGMMVGVGDHEDAITRNLRTAVTEPWRSPLRVPIRSAPSEPEPEPGDVIGRYTLIERLGAGGMGVVFSAHDDRLDRKVAIKLLREVDESATESSEGRTRMQREAQAMAQLSHPHVVQVFDVGEHRGAIYIALALIEGPTLREWLTARVRSWREVVAMFVQAGRGLAAAHAAGLVHRDFKPGNVLVDAQDHARVMDFGLALAAGKGARVDGPQVPDVDEEGAPSAGSSSVTNRLTAPLTEAGTVMGTPAYMALEQHEGQPIGPAADQFAFCASLFEAVYGVRPFAGRSADELWRAKRAGRVVEVPRGGEMPAGLLRVLLRGLAPRPEERWPSMSVLLARLEALSRPRGRWSWIGAGGLAVVLAVGGLGWPWWPRPAESDCAQAQSLLEQAWGEPRREALRAALGRDDASYAADTVARVEHRLDDYAARWLDLHDRICEADPDDAEAKTLRGRQLECLERRRRRMATMVETLADVEADLLQQAAALVQGLPALEGCADEHPDDDGLVLPDDETTALRVSEIHHALEEVQVLLAAGQYPRAHALAAELHERGRALGYAPLSTFTSMWLTDTSIHLGELRGAEEQLVQVLHEAEEAGDYAKVVFVATRLVLLTSDRPEESVRWARHGQARLSRIPDDLHSQATMSASLGMALTYAGRPEEAVAELLKAVELWSAVVGPDDLEVAVARNNLGIAYYDLGRYPEAIEQYEQVHRIRERVQGSEHPDIGATLNNLANATYELGRYEHALVLQQRALKIWLAGLGPEHYSVGALYSNIGNTARMLGRVSEALAAHERSIEIRERALGSEHAEVAVSLINHGAQLAEVGRTTEGLAELRRARSILERSMGDHPWTAAAIGAMGTALSAQGEHEAAAEAQRQALAVMQTLGLIELPMVVEMRRELGDALLALGRSDEAKQQLELALMLEADRGGVTPELAAMAWFSLAKVLRARGEDPARARALAERARSILAAGSPAMERRLAVVEAWLREPDASAPSRATMQ
ncbi:serine/threonine-protein kinase [Paraliomyxa miuraensis]|uniref:serine/threonine-protein kinase n=1 Tax=Paraliomyxa miuraensis TaxID=376150 RepID=UPI002252183A|nr:serine/threonine-protein kinase [Paraliomyxa miuraensis]MCX4247193.1 serine/threonine-protein kinase [Paraliomyxa miuraensis]